MSATPMARPIDARPEERRFARLAAAGPPSGWLSLVLVVVMCAMLALAIDDARIILGRGELTDLLLWSAIAGAVIGSLGPTVGWGRWKTYAIGGILASLIVPLLVGSVFTDVQWDLGRLFTVTGSEVWEAISDIVVRGQRLTNAVGHHMLIIGLWVWASSMFAGYAVFGHRRPINAVLLIGLLLVLNMGLTFNDQLVYLVVFSLAALFLLIRSHSFEEQGDWLRRRIGDPTAIAGIYLRGGTVFIAVAVIGALLLTTVANSAPLQGMWTDVGAQVVSWTRGLSGVLPRSGTAPAQTPEFGASELVSDTWITNDSEAFTVQVDAADIALDVKWRARTWDVITADGFDTSAPPLLVTRPAGEPVLDGAFDAASPIGTRPLVFSVRPAAPRFDLLSPGSPAVVDVTAIEGTLGESGFFSSLERPGGHTRDGYTIQALIPLVGDAFEGGLTGNRLRVAPAEYPPELAALYAQPFDRQTGLVGPAFDEVHQAILAGGADNAYDFAVDTVRYLQSEQNFDYDTDLSDEGLEGCDDRSFVECFAFRRHGFCQQYAGLMVALMREEGYAARVAGGFRTGQPNAVTRTFVVKNNDAHQWVEVYFPDYGWVEFDPTGGSVGEPADLPDGAAQGSFSPRPSVTVTRPPESAAPSAAPVVGSGSLGGGMSAGPLIVVALLLLAIVGAIAFAAWRRGPRGPVTADGAYGMVTRMASRLGFAPRPEQTVYEYAGVLAELIPDSRPELQTVATAKVETAYGARRLEPARMQSLREAQRRLRTSLLRLAVRRFRR